MTEINTLWQTLVTAAYLGTGRQSTHFDSLVKQHASLLGGIIAENPEHFILESAAILSLYRMAGTMPESPVALYSIFSVCEPEEQKHCTPAAARFLVSMLAGQNQELISEWLALVGSVEKMPPEELFPDLLTWGENHLDQIDLLLPVLGKRGRWLASKMPWTRSVAAVIQLETISLDDAGAIWQTEGKQMRQLLFGKLRKNKPLNALELLASTWDEESADDRAEFAALLSDSLSMADEPFLETCLDDRSKKVRDVCAGLLARLGGSRLVNRQLILAQAILKWTPGTVFRKPRFEVILPEECSTAMIRDGIKPKPPQHESIGEKGWWLQQILSVIPPSLWQRQWGQTPEEILEVVMRGEWGDVVAKAWRLAAKRHNDADWAAALFKHDPSIPHLSLREGYGNGVPQTTKQSPALNLIDYTPAGFQEAYIKDQFRLNPGNAVQTMMSFPHQWSEGLSHLLVKNLQRYLKEQRNQSYASHRVIFQTIGVKLHPAVIKDALKTWKIEDEKNDPWKKDFENLIQTLEFRQQMHEELIYGGYST